MDFNIYTLGKGLCIFAISVVAAISVAHADYTIDDIAPYTYSAPELSSGSLIAAISFDHVESIIASDSSGNGNDAVLSDDSVWAPGMSGSAISFGGDSNGVIIPNDIIGVGSVTICLDFNANTIKPGADLLDDGYFSISIDQSGNVVTSDGITLNQVQIGSWQHICTSHTSGVSIPQGSAVTIGNSALGDQHGFDGLIDNVNIYQGIVSGR